MEREKMKGRGTKMRDGTEVKTGDQVREMEMRVRVMNK